MTILAILWPRLARDGPEWQKVMYAFLCPMFYAWVAVTLRDVGVFLEYPANTESCRVLPGSEQFWSSEDVAFWKDGLAVVTAGDLHHVFRDGIEAAAPGRLYAVDLGSAAPEAREVAVSGFPEGLRFQPHGIFVSKPRIYVTSHPGGSAGSRVEILEGVERGGALVGAKYVRSVVHPLLAFNGSPNDVVEGASPDEIYVSRWLPDFAPIPEKGEDGELTREEKLGSVAFFFANLLKVPVTRVYRCVLGAGDAATCDPVGKRHAMANGMAISEDRKTIYTADPVAFSVTVYARRADGSLRHADTISLPHAPDNVQVLPGSDVLAIGTLPVLKASIDAKKTRDFVAVPGTLLLAQPGKPPKNDTLKRAYGVRSKGDPRWTFTDVAVTDGTQGVSQISAGTLYGTTALLGSPYAQGALLCDAASF